MYHDSSCAKALLAVYEGTHSFCIKLLVLYIVEKYALIINPGSKVNISKLHSIPVVDLRQPLITSLTKSLGG